MRCCSKGANYQEALYYVREDTNSFMRRQPKLYLWATVTRFMGFKRVKMPLKYYPWAVLPMVALFGNEVRKAKVVLSQKLKG